MTAEDQSDLIVAAAQAACANEPELEERVRKAMRSTSQHGRGQVFLALALIAAGRETAALCKRSDRYKSQMKMLNRSVASLNALMSAEMGRGKLADGGSVLPLLVIWRGIEEGFSGLRS